MQEKWTGNLPWTHTQNIENDSCDGNTCQNTNTARQVRRCHNSLQNLSFLMRCMEQWLAHGWHRKGTNIVRGDRPGKQTASHQGENVAGLQHMKGISNAERNVCSTLQIDSSSVCFAGIDSRDDRHGFDIQCKSTRNYEWTNMWSRRLLQKTRQWHSSRSVGKDGFCDMLGSSLRIALHFGLVSDKEANTYHNLYSSRCRSWQIGGRVAGTVSPDTIEASAATVQARTG